MLLRVFLFEKLSSDYKVSLMCPILFVYTDGGHDHRSTFWSGKLAHIATFGAFDLVMLIAARTAPSQSFCNPARSMNYSI